MIGSLLLLLMGVGLAGVFGREVFTALRGGSWRAKTSFVTRADQPLLFWTGLSVLGAFGVIFLMLGLVGLVGAMGIGRLVR